MFKNLKHFLSFNKITGWLRPQDKKDGLLYPVAQRSCSSCYFLISRQVVFVILGAAFLTGCGYRAGVGNSPRSRSLSVPFVEGDRTGCFTAELIKQVAMDGTFRYAESKGDLLLRVCLSDIEDESIGYRYETNYYGVRGQRLVASEDRLKLAATITLVDCRSGRILLGPLNVCSNVDFDFEPETSQQNQTRFSLGQLDFREAALDDAKVPLYRKLAKEIVDYITKTW